MSLGFFLGLNQIRVFISSFEGKAGLWKRIPLEVKIELWLGMSLLPLAVTNFRLPFDSVVTASDASETGAGLVMSTGLKPMGAAAVEAAVRGETSELPDDCQVLGIGLFDGIGALRVALDVLQAPVGGYIAVESDAGARRVVEANFAAVLQLSSVEEVTEEEVRQWALRFSRVHLVIIGGGPPCQGVSGLNFGRKGAVEDPRSSLHSHVKRIVDLVRSVFTWAKVFFLMESVFSMSWEDQAVYSTSIEVLPYLVAAKHCSLARRPRLWGHPK